MDESGLMMYDNGVERFLTSAGDYDMAAYSSEANLYHITSFGTQDNPKVMGKMTLTRGFDKMAFPKIVRVLRDEHLPLRQKALLMCTELVSTGESAVQCLDAGLVEALAENLGHEDVLCRERAAAALELVAGVCGTKGCERMNEAGATEKLFGILDDAGGEEVRMAAYGALVEAATRSAKVQATMCAGDLLPKQLAKSLEAGAAEASVALELVRICLAGRNHGLAERLLSEAGAISTCAKLIAAPESEEQVVGQAAAVLQMLCVPYEGKEEAVKAGVLEPLLKLVDESPHQRLQVAASACVMSITIADAGKAALVECGGVEQIQRALEVEDEKVCLNILQIITNVCEHPVGREKFQVVGPKLAQLQSHHIAVLQRHAMLCKRQVDFLGVGLP
mmetsp:Transcript_1597/g.5840  ORF Transcript_1597/g.5840 Transcript_1597/m.5840 type:complete len:392 (-) Transcript_1597:2-1177(-)